MGSGQFPILALSEARTPARPPVTCPSFPAGLTAGCAGGLAGSGVRSSASAVEAAGTSAIGCFIAGSVLRAVVGGRPVRRVQARHADCPAPAASCPKSRVAHCGTDPWSVREFSAGRLPVHLITAGRGNHDGGRQPGRRPDSPTPCPNLHVLCPGFLLRFRLPVFAVIQNLPHNHCPRDSGSHNSKDHPSNPGSPSPGAGVTLRHSQGIPDACLVRSSFQLNHLHLSDCAGSAPGLRAPEISK